MGHFYNNGVAGAGVSKERQKQNSVSRFFTLFGRKFGKLFLINIIYFAFCVPIITFGPATAAMTALMRNIYLEKPMFILHDFWQEFKKNFKQSVFIGLLDVAAIVLGVLALLNYGSTGDDMGAKVLYWFCVAAQVIFLMLNFYIYPQIVALDLPLGAIIKNSFILIFVNLGGELISLLFFAGYAALLYFFNIIVIFAAPLLPLAWLGWITFFCCYPAIQRVLIDPYYEKTGEKNPELPDEEGKVFSDQGGSERPINVQNEKPQRVQAEKSHGKVIK